MCSSPLGRHGGSWATEGYKRENVPKLVGAPAGKKVAGASAGHIRTAVWTEAGELVTFGYGVYGQLGHGGVENKLMPRLVEGLIGEQWWVLR